MTTTADNTTLDLEMLRHLRSTFASALKDFAASESSFRVLHSVPPSSSQPPSSSISKANKLYVLDSSFNPPSRAHLHIAASAVLSESQSKRQSQDDRTRVLLLLATQNADKAPKPAAFEDRLVMMTLMAEDLRQIMLGELASSLRKTEGAVPVVDVAVTKLPFFVNKAAAIDESGVYGEQQPHQRDEAGGAGTEAGFEQVHLVGYDTLVRIFDPKYYDSKKGLSVLGPFLARHRLRVLCRVDEKGNGGGGKGKEEQREWVRSVHRGEKESEGVRREWAERIELVDSGGDDVNRVSSTEARKCVKECRWADLGSFVGPTVETWIKDRSLYAEEEK